jgi:hypothetical protein
MGSAMIINRRNRRTSNSLTVAVAITVFATSPIVGGTMSPVQARKLQCNHALAQYVKAIKVLEAEGAEARALAARNPLYESDVAYYASVLADAKQCIRNLAPVATVSR